MSDSEKQPVGSIGWMDLTVADAEGIRDFYGQVVGWEDTAHDMGEYSDYCMDLPDTGETVAGICHARGANAKVPPQWLIYIRVADVDESASRCEELGGKVIDGPRESGGSKFCVIQDPAGAVAALVE